LLGHSDLRWSSGPDDNHARCGFFECAAGAQPMVDIVAAVEKAESATAGAPDDKTALADLTAATDRVAALDLEIRDADGRTLETTKIEIRDMACVPSCVDRPFDDDESMEEPNGNADGDEDFLERELFEQQPDADLASAALLESFDDEPACSLDDDLTRYVLAVTFANAADCPPAHDE
jgi:hypothetical protein